jgi:hypothetical protein
MRPCREKEHARRAPASDAGRWLNAGAPVGWDLSISQFSGDKAVNEADRPGTEKTLSLWYQWRAIPVQSHFLVPAQVRGRFELTLGGKR